VARLEGDRLTDATGRTIARPQGLRRRQVIAYYYFFWKNHPICTDFLLSQYIGH
jgi:hypothetical protein